MSTSMLIRARSSRQVGSVRARYGARERRSGLWRERSSASNKRWPGWQERSGAWQNPAVVRRIAVAIACPSLNCSPRLAPAAAA
jgi:hypothetical protein